MVAVGERDVAQLGQPVQARQGLCMGGEPPSLGSGFSFAIEMQLYQHAQACRGLCTMLALA